MVDKTVFFMEAILRICSSLEIETALWKCLLYLKNYIPATRMAFHVYDYELGILETIALASHAGGRTVSEKIHLPPELRTSIKKNWIQGIHYIGNLKENIYTKIALDAFDLSNGSAIIMDLMLEKKEVGMVTIFNEQPHRFSSSHVDLIRLLNEPFAVAITNALRYRELVGIKEALAEENRYLQDELYGMSGKEVVGQDSGLRPVMDMVRQVADHDSPVLLLGETGTGKEVIANAIHNLSNRRNNPFIKINCGAIPDALLDSELFGHEKGAFTGAVKGKRGRFERAHTGTLFLDEIGELPLNAQVRLLRVLQEKELERVGGTSLIKTDVRVIAATHRDLESMLKKGQFRQDLYFRIKVFPIQIPPLRQRQADIPMLVQYLIQKKSRELKKNIVPRLAPDSIDRLLAYNWPGNVRELENVVERALIMNQGAELLDFEVNAIEKKVASFSIDMVPSESLHLDRVNAAHIKLVLKMTQGRIDGPNGAATLLGINANTLRNRMKKLDIPFGRKIKRGRFHGADRKTETDNR